MSANDPDAYRSLLYISSFCADIDLNGNRKESFGVSVRDNGEESIGVVYKRDELQGLLARELLRQRGGRFEYDSISLVLNNANSHTIPKEIYEAMLQTSPHVLLQRGVARISALGEERKLLEDIARETFNLLEKTLGKDTLQRLAPKIPGEYNHNLLPMNPVEC